MTRRLLLLLAAATAFGTNLSAQSRAEMLRRYPWVDTTGESSVYPIGDAVDVYRAALDLLYKDGDRHPSVIVVHDTIERGGEGPCPVECTYVWHHKSKMDTTTILAFARQSPKRPRFKKFDYSIPIVLLSYDGRQLLEHEGIGYLAAHNLPNDFNGRAAGTGFSLKFPGAWGLAQFGKVGFNTNHTEALVQVRHSCFESCGSDEALFLKRLNGRWTVIERIPTYAEVYRPPGQPYAQRSPSRGSLQYRGPAGSTPSESEIVGDDNRRRVVRSERADAAAIYRAVLDSLYDFQGETPPVVVLTDVFRTPLDTVRTPKTQLDSGLLQKYAFLASVHATPERAFKYRLPVRIFLADSMARLDSIGARMADPNFGNQTVWIGLKREVPGAWGMVGFSNVAVNLAHTQAMVYSDHQCGESCGHGDTWVLERKRETWHVVERIPGGKYPYWEPLLFPLRYVGLDAKPDSYRHRRVYVYFRNAVTDRPLSSTLVRTRRSFDNPAMLTTDAGGRLDLGAMPFAGYMEMAVACPDQSEPDSLFAGSIALSPGSDTSVTTRINYRECFKKSEVPRGLTGAQAFISATEARFIFPFRAPGESWDLATRLTVPGTTDYFWIVDFRDSSQEGDLPISLWLRASLQPSSPRPRSLADLISNSALEPMLECHTCDPSAVYAEPGFDRKHIFARADSGRIVFVVRGRETVHHLFQRIPERVDFDALVRHSPPGKRSDMEISESQAVIVNCRPSDSTAAGRRRCNAPTRAQQATPAIDSTSPRRVRIVALTYDGSSLVRNLDVRVRSEDRKDPSLMRSTGASGNFSILQPPRDSVTISALCAGASGDQQPVSGQLALYIAPGRDTTLQLMVDPRRCSR